MSTGVLCYFVVATPMIDRTNNFIHIFNETIILLCIWMLFLFTDYTAEAERRHTYGTYFLYVIALNFAVNFLVLLWVIVH